ncbi:MAG: transglutaminase domain-containing protein, partial [Lachnospiraceae bacterium]|nr:transglutaminase domain-containing protein [Lachnospiraceae bacterium]
SDYYQGFSGLGETALVEVEVADDHAHAWVEIYLDGQGWVIFDPTPAAEEEEETGSFWDEFFERMNRQEGEESSQQSELNAYLNNALKGGAYTGLAVLAAALLFLGGRSGIRKYREMHLPVPERVRLEYQRMTGRLKKKEEEFRRLTTPEEELDWIEEHFGIENPEELKQEIYRIFFADQTGPEAEETLKKLICLRRKIRS